MKQLQIRKEFTLTLDDDIYELLKDKTIYRNQSRVISTVWDVYGEQTEKSVASIVYFIRTQHWTKAKVDGVHKKDGKQTNLQFDNLELHDWNWRNIKVEQKEKVARGKAQSNKEQQIVAKEGKLIAFR